MRIRIPARFRTMVPVPAAVALLFPFLLHIACNSSGSAPAPAVRTWGPPELIALGVFVGPDPPINPAVAISPAGDTVVAWETSPFPIKIEGARYSPAAGWSSVVQLSETGPSDAVVPEVVMDDAGNGIVVWYQDDGTRFNIWSRRYAAGSGWDNALMIENETGDASRPAIAMSSTGNAVAVWHQYDNTFNSIRTNRYVPSSGWGTAEGVESNTGDAFDARVGIAANGDTVAVWSQFDGTRFNIWSNRYRAGTGWDSATLIETDDAGDAQAPQVAVISTGDAVAVWSQFDGTRFNIWSNRYRVGTGWDNATRIEADDAGDADRPRLAMDSSGNAIAVWQQSDGSNNRIRSNRYRQGSGWETAIRIDSEGSGNAERPSLAMDPSGNAVAAWIWNDGTNYKLQMARYR